MPGKVSREGDLLVVKGGEVESARKTDRIKERISERFHEIFADLVQHKSESLVIFDTCSHTGVSMGSVQDRLEEMGFEDVRIVTANPPDRSSGIKTDADVHDQTLLTSCYPFGGDSVVTKGDDLVSKINLDADRGEGIKIREEIRDIIKHKGY